MIFFPLYFPFFIRHLHFVFFERFVSRNIFTSSWHFMHSEVFVAGICKCLYSHCPECHLNMVTRTSLCKQTHLMRCFSVTQPRFSRNLCTAVPVILLLKALVCQNEPKLALSGYPGSLSSMLVLTQCPVTKKKAVMFHFVLISMY